MCHLLTHLLTDSTRSMQQSPSSEVNRPKSSQEFPVFFFNTKLYNIHKRPPPPPIQSQINPAHFSLSYFLKIHFNVITSTPRSFNLSLSLVSYSKFRMYLSSPINVTFPAYLILDFTCRSRIAFGEEYRT
jgi:hypothetical protein